MAINGKRDDIQESDLIAEAATMGVPASRVAQFFAALADRAEVLDRSMRQSFVPDGICGEYRRQINKRLKSLGRPALF